MQEQQASRLSGVADLCLQSESVFCACDDPL